MKYPVWLAFFCTLAPVAPSNAAEPPVLLLRHDDTSVHYRVSVSPGVPKPGKRFEIELELSQALETPDPRYGSEKPLNDAEVALVLLGPSNTVSHRAVRLRDAGTFGVTFTAAKEGAYSLYVVGEDDDAGAFHHGWPISVGVWPPPKDQTLAALPKTLPAPAPGNLTHGRALCARHCRRAVKGALPTAKPPTYLSSAFAAAKSDAQLLETFIDRERARKLSRLEENDLLHYLRSLHVELGTLFPDAARYVAKRFTINDYGLERLRETANLKLEGDARSGVVFVAYRGEKDGRPVLIDYDDTIARDGLDRDGKLGYVVFFDRPRDQNMREVAIAMGREPTYPIHKIVVRNAAGALNRKLNGQLAAFIGQGEFNNAKSLKTGPKGLRKQLLPMYLVAAELATMYFGAEREFSAFDDEL